MYIGRKLNTFTYQTFIHSHAKLEKIWIINVISTEKHKLWTHHKATFGYQINPIFLVNVEELDAQNLRMSLKLSYKLALQCFKRKVELFKTNNLGPENQTFGLYGVLCMVDRYREEVI